MDKVTKRIRSRIMSSVRSRGNRTTELRLRALLARYRVRGWKVQPKEIAGSPDFAFPKERIAIFVDGAFWHGAPSFDRLPHCRAKFWKDKIAKNRMRDRTINSYLRRMGWSVIRIWDFDLAEKTSVIIEKIRLVLYHRRSQRVTRLPKRGVRVKPRPIAGRRAHQ